MKRILTTLIITLTLLAACASPTDRTGTISLSHAPLIGKFVWHDLITDQLSASKRFYGGLLGWTFHEAVRPGGGPYTLVLDQGEYVGGMVTLDDHPDKEYSRWLGYLSVADVDSAVTTTLEAGGKTIIGPRDIGSIGRAAAVRDPQGAVLGLIRSAHGDPVDQSVMMAGAVAWNELVTSNATQAAGFYERLAGYRPKYEKHGDHEYIILRRGGRLRAGVMDRPDERIEPLWLTYFAVSNVEQSARKATELGGEVLVEPAEDIRDGTIAVLRGPEGAVFGVQEIGQ
jgi:predicted enzyme related to lactoylglutathione lyase